MSYSLPTEPSEGTRLRDTDGMVYRRGTWTPSNCHWYAEKLPGHKMNWHTLLANTTELFAYEDKVKYELVHRVDFDNKQTIRIAYSVNELREKMYELMLIRMREGTLTFFDGDMLEMMIDGDMHSWEVRQA